MWLLYFIWCISRIRFLQLDSILWFVLPYYIIKLNLFTLPHSRITSFYWLIWLFGTLMHECDEFWFFSPFLLWWNKFVCLCCYCTALCLCALRWICVSGALGTGSERPWAQFSALHKGKTVFPSVHLSIVCDHGTPGCVWFWVNFDFLPFISLSSSSAAISQTLCEERLFIL